MLAYKGYQAAGVTFTQNTLQSAFVHVIHVSEDSPTSLTLYGNVITP